MTDREAIMSGKARKQAPRNTEPTQVAPKALMTALQSVDNRANGSRNETLITEFCDI